MRIVLGVVAALVLAYLAAALALWVYLRRHPDVANSRDVLRLVPDVLRLTKRLAGDRSLPTGVRVRMVLLVGYLASPIDLIPDFVPVLGYLDDVVVIALVLRSVIRRAGPEAIARHWPGTPGGLALLGRLVGLPPPSTE